jgi:hypothetical protein
MVLLIKQTRMKQTAIEWLQEQLECFGNKHELQMSWTTVDELLKQAKAMEKEQIEDAYEIGFADAWDDARYDDEPTYAGAEQYYNKTYGDKTP